MSEQPPRVGILAIQGDVDAHAEALRRVGAQPCRVRRAKDLDALAALVLPGGESTTISKGLERLGLYEPLAAFAASGRPLLGTCAGAVLLAREVENHPVRCLGLLDVTAVRRDIRPQRVQGALDPVNRVHRPPIDEFLLP